MQAKDWFVAGHGKCQACEPVREWDLLRTEYRFYRFLTEVEDILIQFEDREMKEQDFLPRIQRLVRQLLLNCYWIQTKISELCLNQETSVVLLYDEVGFPLTVQLVAFAPGIVSSIHNHGTWGIVGVLQGQEKNIFWKRDPSQEFPNKIVQADEKILQPGDIISLTSETIHCIEAIAENQPTITFNLYGETHGDRRFEFNSDNHTAKRF